MGVTISSENFSADMGYNGFNRFRLKVAELYNPLFGEHYKSLDNSIFLSSKERDNYFKEYNRKTTQLIKSNIITVEIANFCYQSDVEGKINQSQAKQIYEKIKDYDDDICYGYSGKKDCAMFSDLKRIVKDCSDNGGYIEWH